jgi:hypothetical protein
MTTGPTCDRCGANLISGYLEGSSDADPPEQACPNCNPDHPFSVSRRESMAKRDPTVADKMTIVIYGRDLPGLEVWDAVRRFVHETFNADWSVDLRMEAEPVDGERLPPTADGMLHLLNAEPTLLPKAPATFTAQDIDHRHVDAIHSCLRCGKRATVAYVANTDIGNRWLDLCAACNHWLRA